MIISDLIRHLNEGGIGVSLVDSADLEVSFDGECLSPDLYEIIRSNKAEIIAFLRQFRTEKIPLTAPASSYAVSSAVLAGSASSAAAGAGSADHRCSEEKSV